ncbi:MAG TPA: YncE family protein [Verrucomicrobiae bacterium]|nr:YncE family protein [Verrucomicrobiae bacterium]
MKLNSLVLLSLFGLTTATVTRAADPYHFLKDIPIGGEGGWDYLSVDPVAHRLYVSHGNSVVVVDLQKDTVVGEITNTPGVHGLAPAPELGRGLTTNGRENKASLVDLETLKTLSKAETGEGPDGMLYEPGRKEFYTFNGRGQSSTVIDAKTGSVVATIELGGRPESAEADPDAGRVYDNIESKSEVAVIDTEKHKVIASWPIAPGEEASGMAIDTAHHRIFCGCHNNKMVMLDTTSGKVVADVPIGQGVDACAFDPGTQLAFASCGDGTVTIAHEDGLNTLSVVQKLPTERGARTMALDPTTHKIYLASAKFEAPTAGQNGEGRRGRGRMVPGSFKILVYGTDK